MKPSINKNDGELLVASAWVAGARVADSVVALTHILGRRRLICSNLVAEILLQDFQNPATADEVARRRNAPIELIRDVVRTLRAALLLKRTGIDETAAIRSGLDVHFAEADLSGHSTGGIPERLYLGRRQEPRDRPDDAPLADSAVTLDTRLQLSSAITAMQFEENSGGVITHILEGPVLLADGMWKLAMAFRELTSVREAIDSASLQENGAEQLILSCQFLVRRRVLCASPDDDAAAICECVSAETALIRQRFEVDKILTPTGYEDPHFVWYQPYGYFDLDMIRPVSARGTVAFIGQCQSHFIAGALEYLGQCNGWHLETHGWFDVPDDLGARDWSLIVLPTVVEAAAFYEALAVGDIAGCRKAMPEVVAEVDRSVCLIRDKTDAPVLVISAGEPSLHGHGMASTTRHAMKQVIAELNGRLQDSVSAFEFVHLLDETGVLSNYPDAVTLDDEFNASPHHCGFDLWSWRDHPFQAPGAAVPNKTANQIHPAAPLALACIEHLRHLYSGPRVKLIVFEPNGLLWPGVIEPGSKPYPKGINVYTGLSDFVHMGIHEALCAVRMKGINLACVSSSETELLKDSLEYDSEAQNLVRHDDLVGALGGSDKAALLDQIIEMAGVREEEVLWIDRGYKPQESFAGQHYDDEIWKLRRFLLTEPLLSPVSAIDQPPQPIMPDIGESTVTPQRNEVSVTLDTVLSRHLKCSDSDLNKTDDLRLLGLDSFGCAQLVLELEDELHFKWPDHDYIGSVMFSRRGLLTAITRALEPDSTDGQCISTSPDAWFENFTRESWCNQDIASILAHHFETPGVGWILKFVRSGKAFDYEYVTWRELYGRALGYTRLFKAAGLNPGDTVSILLPQGPCLVAAVVGAIVGGMLPSISAFPSEKLTSQAFLGWFSELVRASQTRCVVCTDELRSLVEDELKEHALTASIVTTIPEAVFDEPIHVASPDSPVLLQHSSGTTGIKKGVRLTQRALLAQIWDLSKELGCNEKDVIVSWLPYYHDMGLIACLMLPLLRSIPTVVMSPFDWVRQPHMLLREISEEHGTVCWLPNFALLHCANRVQPDRLAGLQLGSLRAVINCSEPVTYEAMVAFYERFGQFGMRFSALSSSYAMAENTFAVTQSRVGRPAKTLHASSLIFAKEGRISLATAGGEERTSRFVSSGSILPGAQVRIVNDGVVLDEASVGEILIRSDYLFAGYHNNEESSRAAFDDDWYRTGDLGFLLAGELYVTGRRQDLVIVSGHNVYPHDIEKEIGAIPGIRPGRAVAFGIYDDNEGTEKLVVMAELFNASAGDVIGRDKDALKTMIRESIMAGFFVNVSDIRLFETETLLKSTSGKPARNANRELYLRMNAQPG